MEMLVYVLLMFRGNEQDMSFQVHFRTLTSCSQHAMAIQAQSAERWAYILPKTNKFKLHCEPKIIKSSEAGKSIIFHDLKSVPKDE
jgi:hypothetical protein